MIVRAVVVVVFVFAGCAVDGADEDDCDPGVVNVVEFNPGANAGFGADRMPEIVQGPPNAGLDVKGGSLDVVSLGDEGSIVVELGCPILDRDGEDVDGPDFVVFENAFVIGDGPGVNSEAGVVGVSNDGAEFVDYACDAAPGTDDGVDGCAGTTPGGDEFDLATVGVAEAKFVRVVDRGDRVCCGAPSGGFDLDAVQVVR